MDHLRRSLFLHLALLYGRLVPFPQRKWRICLWLLARGGIHPWQHREAWREAVAHLPSNVVRVRGIRMRCEWSDTADLPFTLIRDHQPYETDLLEKLIRPGDTIIDGGANVGFYTVLFALRSGTGGRIYAYEPVSAAADKLRRNLAENEDIAGAEIVFRQVALGAEHARVPIYLRPSVSGSGIDSQHSSILPGFNTPLDQSQVEEIEVVRLDDEPIESPIDLVKVDVEGAEKAFLEGARRRISEDQPLLVLEWSPSPETYGVDEMIETLRSLGGYEIFLMVRGRLVRATRDALDHFGGDVVCATAAHRTGRLRGLV